MVAIKLRPVGKKKQISFRIVVTPKKSKLFGKYIEDLGWYNPHTDKFFINVQKAKEWIQKGAQPTDTVYNLLVDAKVIEGPKIDKKSKSNAQKQETSSIGSNAAQESQSSNQASE